MDEVLGGLNEKQKEAVECLSGPLLILAGAGSGKTKTLTHRIANLIRHGVEPGRILAVTFTNKAANEMRERLWKLLHGDLVPSVPPRSFMPYMGTFHGICVRILRQEADAAGLGRDFVIYDTDDQLALIRRILKDLNLNTNKNLKPKTIQTIISAEKNKGNTPEDYAAAAFYPNQEKIAKVFFKYEQEKEKSDALDFDDLLLRTLRMFSSNDAVREKWQKKFKHILIDEYQDTNTVQYLLIKTLVNEKRNIAVVGDDWQSIYSWRGADFTNILNFEKDFPGAKCIKLEQNYRSTGNILKAAQAVITRNKTRSNKTLFTEAEEGEPVEVEMLANEKAEANYVALKIINLKKNYPDLSDFAVLYRTNAQSYAFEKAFIDLNLPYKIVGGVRFYDRKEVKDMLSILKLVMNERDTVSLERAMKNILPGVGEMTIAKVINFVIVMDTKRPFEDAALLDVVKSAKAKASLGRLQDFLSEARKEENPGETVKSAVKKFDFSTLLDDGTPSTDERMQNLEVLASTAAEYDSLSDFLADAALMSAADENSQKNSVTLMTLHAAKGLEFPVVFIVGLEEGLFPSARGADTEAELEEERRLMYVGMTRARERLFLSYARERNSYGSYEYKMPSRFLKEIGFEEEEAAGSLGFHDGFDDFDDDFSADFDLTDPIDPFPEDLPVFE